MTANEEKRSAELTWISSGDLAPPFMSQRKKLTEEEVSQLTLEEYEQLNKTYSTLLKSLSLTESDSLQVATLEGDEFVFQITAEGWKVLDGGDPGIRQRTWEMVEDLLRSVSPRFKEGWDVMLLEKLYSISQSQVQDNSGQGDQEEIISEVQKK